MREPEPPPEFNTCTSVEANIAILRAMERIHFRERIRAAATKRTCPGRAPARKLMLWETWIDDDDGEAEEVLALWLG